MQQKRDNMISVQAPALPKGGGAIQSMGEAMGAPGPNGLASVSLPFPISAGRGFAPSLALNYSSGAGNSVFGMGWSCDTLRISRRTSTSVPKYNHTDEFLAPNGEVLVEMVTTELEPNPVVSMMYGNLILPQPYTITRYLPAIDLTSARFEHWRGNADGSEFWLIHDPDGNLHILGKTSQARIADPAVPAHTAVWLLEESVNATGEHIYYRYAAENSDNLDLGGNENGRDNLAMRYLMEVFYGNVTAHYDLFLWDNDPQLQQWLFSVVFDYGERTCIPEQVPPYIAPDSWSARHDSFSSYAFGFELRVHRLCQQILIFHHFPQELNAPHTLVSRLLLEYQQQLTLSMLSAVQQLAYETDGFLQQLPPLELFYSRATDTFDARLWQEMPALSGLNDGLRYQMVDLYGEGIAGVLYRTDAAWLYRAPHRGGNGTDTVAWSDWQTIPEIPSIQDIRGRLLDLNGDGQLDWLIAQPGLKGFFTVKPDKSWSSFTPFDALPAEFFHPEAQFVDLVGSGVADLALLGPRSVRFYANDGEGFAPGIDVGQHNDITLPMPGRDASELVAFADLLGTGQSHLLRIRHNSVTCWPNLGYGRFGVPVDLPLDEDLDSGAAFNPEQLFLADIDGSGAVDLIYAQHDHVKIFMNRCGNGFESARILPLPPGIFYDRLCQLSLADTQGNGMAELVLTVPHMSPSHWRYPFNVAKPYLLIEMNNNMGANYRLGYRSSAQEWLDEKEENPDSVPGLPFALHLLVQTIILDEVTGNTLHQHCRYRQGVYDGKENEFRGFGYLEVEDTGTSSVSVGKNVPLTPPLLSKTWYHCGREHDEAWLYGKPWSGDAHAVTLNSTRLTRFEGGEDVTLCDAELDAETRWWMFRALKGTLLRNENYGLDGSSAQILPYHCAVTRAQVRLQQQTNRPIVMVFALEQVRSNYERLSIQDPQVSQQVTLQFDRYAHPLWTVSVAYPRRGEQTLTPYPPGLPEDTWHYSYDEQQQKLRLTESRTAVINLEDPQAWRVGLPHQSRSNILVYDTLPAEPISFETLILREGLLGDSQTRYFNGQTEIVYVNSTPDLRALVDFQRSAALDDAALMAYEGIPIPPGFDWVTLGYVQTSMLLPVAGSFATEAPVWAVESGFTTYASASGFYRPLKYQSTRLTGPVTSSWDNYWLCILSQKDASGNLIRNEYDYRFLTPVRITDINDNVHEVQLSALGNPSGSSFYGTEEGGAIGFWSVVDFPVSPRMTVADAINGAISPGYRQSISNISIQNLFSWMGTLSTSRVTPEQWALLCQSRLITPEGYIRAAGRRWATSPTALPDLPVSLARELQATTREPVHAVVLEADRYPEDFDQQTRIQLSYSDGFGRVLQQCALVAPGEAWQLEENGDVNVTEVEANPRWVVTGRVEYDNKGQVVRVWQPYFLNSWHYVTDSALRTQGYSDTLYYDATGRPSQTVTAKGHLRRVQYYPWFTVEEDENDTLPEDAEDAGFPRVQH
ncbi:SpvB/TcaC N-terminal domain-containing protein [Enterobacter ludwigii]